MSSDRVSDEQGRSRPAPGRVVLVGAGPGDPDLITLRGLREIAAADVVVVDRLAPRALLERLRPGAEVVDVGKSPYHHPVPQREIEAVLVSHALAGKRVVRLKGGDPYLLGRGGEEVLACRAAGVPVEVVPGVSSALAAPAVAEIPVTFRALATSVTIVSGHEPPDYAGLAGVGGTLVVLMGMTRLPELCAGLVRAGLPGSTPAAVVHHAYSPSQRTVRADLDRLATAVAEAGVRNPAVIVVGDVAAGLRALGEREGR